MQNNEFRPATQKQIQYLQSLGYAGDVEGLTAQECSALINQYSGIRPQAPQMQQAPVQPAYQPTQHQQQVNQQTNNSVVVESHSTELQSIEQNISDEIFTQIAVFQKEQGLVLPDGYSIANALKSAYLNLAANNLLNTNKVALAQSLLDMVIQGLTPAKRQCYFINYNNSVNMMRSYFGDRAVCINAGIAKDIQANIIYEGDDVDVNYVDDRLTVKHTTSWDNFGKPIIGAYAWAILPDGTKIYDIMTIDRIKKSWAMSKNTTNNKLQINFNDDACKRTVIRHMAKNLFNASGNNEIITRSYNDSTENEYDNNREFIKADVNEVHEEQKEQMGKKSLFEDVVEDESI